MNSELLHTLTGSPFNVREFGARGNGGNDDTAAIQAALDAALAAGQTNNTAPLVLIPAGRYRIDQHLGNKECAVGRLVLGQFHGGRVHIRGEGGATLCMTQDAWPDGNLDFLLAVWGGNYTDVVIEGLRFERVCRQIGPTQQTVAIATKGTRTIIRDCTFIDFPQAIWLADAVAPVVAGCRWSYTDGVACGRGSGVDGYPNVGIVAVANSSNRDVTVTNNYWQGTENMGGMSPNEPMDGFYWGASQGAIIRGNTVRHAKVEGIYSVSSPNGNPESFTIVDGNAIDCAWPPALAATAREGVRIAIRAEDFNVQVTNNVIAHARSGLWLRGYGLAGNPRSGGHVTGNTIVFDAADVTPINPKSMSVLFGMLIQNHDRVHVASNQILFPAGTSGSSAAGDQTAGGLPTAGVVVFNSQGVTVEGNQILAAGIPNPQQPDVWGIYLGGPVDTVISNNRVENLTKLWGKSTADGGPTPNVAANTLVSVKEVS